MAAGIERCAEKEPKGEIVIVIEGAVAKEFTDDDLTAMLRIEIESGASTRDAVATVMQATGSAKRRVYNLANRVDG